jgi:hypothetical protein
MDRSGVAKGVSPSVWCGLLLDDESRSLRISHLIPSHFSFSLLLMMWQVSQQLLLDEQLALMLQDEMFLRELQAMPEFDRYRTRQPQQQQHHREQHATPTTPGSGQSASGGGSYRGLRYDRCTLVCRIGVVPGGGGAGVDGGGG